MATLTRLPPLRELVTPFLGQPYAEDECWRLVLDLLQAGGFDTVASDPLQAIQQVVELWFCDDPRDPLALVQPWDWYLLTRRGHPQAGAPIQHIGLVVDTTTFVHSRRGVGVCVEPLLRWRPKLVQLARLRCLE
jgi:hypothetical protein